MTVVSPGNFLRRLSPRNIAILVVTLGMALGIVVLVPGLELATELANSTASLKFIGEQQRAADLMRVSIDAVRDRLLSRGYIQPPLDRLREAVKELDGGVDGLSNAKPAGWFERPTPTAALATPQIAGHASAIREIWAKQRRVVDPLVGFDGIPYRDSESIGTELNDKGRALSASIDAAIPATRHALAQLDKELNAIGTELQAGNARAATELRVVMLTGILIGVILGLFVVVLLVARRRQERSLREARQQTEDILGTVKEGLFLLDENLQIGSAYSAALEKMFQRQDIAGLAFEDLMRNVVSERTLSTAIKYVKLLFAERTKENLVKSINPLGEVEINFDGGQGAMEKRYLEFDFHRVRVDDIIKNVLVSVSDVTARVNLAAELRNSQSQAQGQVDTLLGILHVEPAQLNSFLSDSDASMRMINAVLREPAREEAAFRKKLDTLFRQVHSVKGEAAALGLSSIETRAHAFEDDLKALREKTGLSGNDFLPLVIKLDDLLTHLESVSAMVSRLSRFQGAAHEGLHAAAGALETQSQGAGDSGAGLIAALQHLGERVAADNDRLADLQCVGFDRIPERYRRVVKDIAVQAVRNAIVHGIESPGERLAAGKSQQGTVRLEFRDQGQGGYKFSVEDDGQGLSTERIKEAALAKGFISDEEAAALDAKQAMALLFKPGFSTVDGTTKDAGRGVGMNIVAEMVRDVGGRVALATSPGKFTRLTLSFPRVSSRSDDTEAA